MPRVLVNRDKCVGLGVCESMAPDLFVVNDAGELELPGDGAFDETRRADAEAGVHGCPVEALTVQD